MKLLMELFTLSMGQTMHSFQSWVDPRLAWNATAMGLDRIRLYTLRDVGRIWHPKLGTGWLQGAGAFESADAGTYDATKTPVLR